MDTLPYIISPLQEYPQTSLMGEVSIPAPNKHFKRTPHDWILYVILEGTMNMQEDNRQYLLSAGDILILSPQKCHWGIPVNDSIHYFYVHFHWDTLKDILLTPEEYQKQKIEIQEQILHSLEGQGVRDYLLLPKFLHPSRAVFKEIKEDVLHLLQYNKQALPHQQAQNNCLLFLLLLKLSRTELEQQLPKAPCMFSYTLPVIRYLKEHLGEKITSGDLEKEFHHNFDYMNRKFKESMGTTIFSFLEKCRIEESKKMLESGGFSITEIAETLGFCNAFYFAKVFKKHEHMSPREYRREKT